MPFITKSASSKLYYLRRFNTSVHVTTKWGQKNLATAGQKNSHGCLLRYLGGRTSKQEEHVISQFVPGRAPTPLFKNIGTRSSFKPVSEPPGFGCADNFDVQTGLRNPI